MSTELGAGGRFDIFPDSDKCVFIKTHLKQKILNMKQENKKGDTHLQ